MKRIQEINWKNFGAKFNGKEQNTFEWLCYLLFCKEFNKSKGIFSYKNQSGIETNPIDFEGQIIGWQAKYYDTKLSEHKNDLIKCIDTTLSKYPDINHIIFYSNKAFGQGKKGNKPKVQLEVEDHAKSKNISIEWRVTGFFESPFVCEENYNIAHHFFSSEKSLIDLIDELNEQTESILKPINSEIIFGKNKIKINRSKVIVNIRSSLKNSQIVIISGAAGTGKTAVIKDYYNNEKQKASFFVFKAMAFNISNVNQLFKDHGNYTLLDFINIHDDISEKIVVIDSAEKISDLEYQEVFQEFLSTLVNNNWKIIFTTRHSYLDGLKQQFIEVYRLNFTLLNLNELTHRELIDLSDRYKFSLPDNQRLCELIYNPFYLNEYLLNYKSIGTDTSYSDFKNILWNKQISQFSYKKNNTHIKRENCFITIAQKRANEGSFFVKITEYDEEILKKLENDEIIKYDSNTDGYFITHDIYEEWALEKVIERTFQNSLDRKGFLKEIGSSLPIRRAFRKWLSEKLYTKDKDIYELIDSIFTDSSIQSYWHDEILISVLLSDYSNDFFGLYEDKLFEDDQKLLLKIIFLLRIACKDIDQELLNKLGTNISEFATLKYIFTCPKGDGWDNTISIISKHIETLGIEHLSQILPLLDDWNKKYKTGITTKNASQIALFYFHKIIEGGGFGYSSQNKTKIMLIRTIFNGSAEIKQELLDIFNNVLTNSDTDRRGKYYSLAKAALTSIPDSLGIINTIPETIIDLADLFWFKVPEESDGLYSYRSYSIEKHFCITEEHDFSYHPSSAYQTPIYQLLKIQPIKTIDFIISFTNKTVECYTKSGHDRDIEKIQIYIEDKDSIDHYISGKIWNTYRGGQGSTNILESMHMALEKWLLEIGDSLPREDLEELCLNLLRKSNSASITAVIMSVVQAFPDKLFNIAALLSKTKRLYFYDIGRWTFDQTAKSLYAIGYGMDYSKQIFQDERIKTCEDSFRKEMFEHIILKYQLYRNKSVSEKEGERRQKVIWEILDDYNADLPEESEENPADKNWRLILTRMDRRKLDISSEEKDGKYYIKLDPQIDPELNKYRENALKENSKVTEFLPLQLWSRYRYENDKENYLKYDKYESDPISALKETKEIIEKLQSHQDDIFQLSNMAVPAFVCSVLIRDFFDELKKEDKNYCKDIIIEYSSLPIFTEGYNYQVADGTEPTIEILSRIIHLFPDDRKNSKSLLLMLLLSPWNNISNFAVQGIIEYLWEDSIVDANSIFIGYLQIKPLYDELHETIRKENYEQNIYSSSYEILNKTFLDKYEKEIDQIIENNVNYDDLTNISDLDIETLNMGFGLLPLKTNNTNHLNYLEILFDKFSKSVFEDVNSENYEVIGEFLKKYAYTILNFEKTIIPKFIKPFIDNFKLTDNTVDILREFIYAENVLNNYEEFWIVWNAFYPKIIESSQVNNSYSNQLIKVFLFAGIEGSEKSTEWHTLKEKNKSFFSSVVKDMGHNPAVLYSISKILDDIGSVFIDEGITWINEIIKKNDEELFGLVDDNTIYYLKKYLRKYYSLNSQKIRQNTRIRNKMITILNFLIKLGSTSAYLLRERIL